MYVRSILLFALTINALKDISFSPSSSTSHLPIFSLFFSNNKLHRHLFPSFFIYTIHHHFLMAHILLFYSCLPLIASPENALMIAARHGHYQIVRKLLKRGKMRILALTLCMYVCMCVYMYVCMYVCVYVCMFV